MKQMCLTNDKKVKNKSKCITVYWLNWRHYNISFCIKTFGLTIFLLSSFSLFSSPLLEKIKFASIGEAKILLSQNDDQKLADLLYAERIDEAINYYAQYGKNIYHPFVADSYRLITNIYTNQQDSVLAQFPRFVKQYYGNIVNKDVLYFLLETNFKLGNYELGLKLLDVMEVDLENNGQFIRLKQRYQAIRQFPKSDNIKELKEFEPVHIPIQIEPLLIFDVSYNTNSLKTVFDTGCFYPFFTSKKNANKIVGLRMIEAYTETLINGKEMSAAYGVMDSVRIGERLLMKNIPIMIIENDLFSHCIPDSVIANREKAAKIDSTFNQMEIIMGLPVIKMLHHIQLDLCKKEMILSCNKETEEKEKNMYIASNALYINTKVNNLDFTAFFDTGGNLDSIALIICNEFYQNHINQFPVLPNKQDEVLNNCWVHGTTSNNNFLRPAQLNMKLGDNYLNLHDETLIYTSEFQFPQHKDGYIGWGLLKKLKHLTFDFKAMRLDCE